MDRHPAPHSLLAKVFHWVFIGVYAYGVVKPVDEVEELSDPAFLAEEFLYATAFLTLLLVRFLYMRSFADSQLHHDASGLIQRLARFVHLALYACLAMLALSGIAIGGLYASSIESGAVFGLMLWLHEACYWSSVTLIGVHILGAIYHRILGDGIWSSMVPVFKERDARPYSS